MAEPWLEDGENIAGSWSVFLGDPGPNSAKTTGKIFVTDRYVRFQAGLALEQNAAAKISEAYFHPRRDKPFEMMNDHIAIPFADIGAASIVKKGFLQKALLLKLKSGTELEFQFGAMSPQKALDGITAKLS